MESESQDVQNGENGTNGENVDSLDKHKTEEEEEDEEDEEVTGLISKDQCEALAEKLGSEWKKLAAELNFPEDDVKYLESEAQDVKDQALKMLTLWTVCV